MDRKDQLQGYEHTLLGLFNTSPLSEAPTNTRRYGKHYETVIAIGKDHVAHVTMDDDAYEALKELTKEG